MKDRDFKNIEKPSYTMYNELKQTDVEKCEKVDIEFKRLYHKKSKLRGCYNIYKLIKGKGEFYIVEHYDCADNIYDYDVFDSFEDAMAYIYS